MFLKLNMRNRKRFNFEIDTIFLRATGGAAEVENLRAQWSVAQHSVAAVDHLERGVAARTGWADGAREAGVDIQENPPLPVCPSFSSLQSALRTSSHKPSESLNHASLLFRNPHLNSPQALPILPPNTSPLHCQRSCRGRCLLALWPRPNCSARPAQFHLCTVLAFKKSSVRNWFTLLRPIKSFQFLLGIGTKVPIIAARSSWSGCQQYPRFTMRLAPTTPPYSLGTGPLFVPQRH